MQRKRTIKKSERVQLIFMFQKIITIALHKLTRVLHKLTVVVDKLVACCPFTFGKYIQKQQCIYQCKLKLFSSNKMFYLSCIYMRTERVHEKIITFHTLWFSNEQYISVSALLTAGFWTVYTAMSLYSGKMHQGQSNDFLLSLLSEDWWLWKECS